MNKDEQRLVDAGWWETDQKLWLRKGLNTKWGGYSLGSALKKQEGLDIIAKYGAFYYFTRDQFGFGYWIGVYDSPADMPHRTKFDHLDRETAEKVVKALNTNHFHPPEAEIKKDFQQVLIFNEKYRNRYFVVNNRPELSRVALKIVTEREAEGWYCFDREKPKKPEFSKEEVRKYTGRVGKAMVEECEYYDRALENFQKEEKLQKVLEKILKDKDTELALRFLVEMKSGEYEGFELVSPEQI